MDLSPEEYVLDETEMEAYVESQNKTYQNHEFFLRNDSFLEICSPDQEEKPDNDPVLPYFTMTGLFLSITFLILHIAIFAATPRLRNTSSTNLASLCVSLLFLYLTFIASGFLKPRSTSCIVVAVVLHYSLLTSFCWMLVISFDVWRALRGAICKLQVSSGFSWRKFTAYSLCSWILPAGLVGVALVLEFLDSVSISESSRPGYGRTNCWFDNGDALLIFGVVPLAVTMGFNVLFFSWSAYLIYSTKSEMKNSSASNADVRLYARLGLIMGLTWTTGVIAAYVNLTGMWYVFVLLNTLQGIFIFIAFTCTNKVWKELQTLRRRKNEDEINRKPLRTALQEPAKSISDVKMTDLEHSTEQSHLEKTD